MFVFFQSIVRCSVSCTHAKIWFFKEEEHQLSSYTPLLCRPDAISPPEPGHEPMQVDSTRLSSSERQETADPGLMSVLWSWWACDCRMPNSSTKTHGECHYAINNQYAALHLYCEAYCLRYLPFQYTPSLTPGQPGTSSPGISAASSSSRLLPPKPPIRSNR